MGLSFPKFDVKSAEEIKNMTSEEVIAYKQMKLSLLKAKKSQN
jgi:hypothetical protein